MFQHGDYNLFYQWLKDNVYSQGRLLTSEELCQKITGRNLDVSSYQRYVQNKFAV
jgi:carboxypeptidase Taq